ncbi:MAG: MFS transporter [Acidobacteriota bacterium]
MFAKTAIPFGESDSRCYNSKVMVRLTRPEASLEEVEARSHLLSAMSTPSTRPAAILGVLFLLGLIAELDYQTIPALLPLLSQSFAVDPAYAGYMVPVYSFSSGVFSLFFGSLSDHWGRIPFLKYGLVVFCVAALTAAISGALGLFLLSRFLAGMSAGAVTTCSTSYAADYFDYHERGRAMGVLSTTYFAAAIVGVPAATQVASRWGWQPIFLTTAVLAAVAVLLVGALVPPQPKTAGFPSPRRDLDLPAFKDSLVRFARKREILALLMASLLSSGSVVGFITYLGSHLNRDLNQSIDRVGLVFLLCGAFSLLGAPLSGWLSDRWGKKSLLILSGLVLVACLGFIPSLNWGYGLFVALACTGLAMAFRIAPLLAIITELAGSQDRGKLLAVRSTLSQLGIGGVTLAAAYCFGWGRYQAVGWLASGLMLVSTVLILFLVEEPSPQKSQV